MWEDYALSSMGLVFIISLFPSILGKDKPALATSLLSCGGLVVNIFAFSSLGLWYSAVASVTLLILWSILAYQKITQKKDSLNKVDANHKMSR